MTRTDNPVTGTFVTEHGTTRIGRNTLMYLGTIALIGALFFIGMVASQVRGPQTVEARPLAGDAVDGWLPGITEANRAARLEAAEGVQDGWSSAFLKAEPAITDGWSSYLLREEPAIVDGWAARYLVDDDE